MGVTEFTPRVCPLPSRVCCDFAIVCLHYTHQLSIDDIDYLLIIALLNPNMYLPVQCYGIIYWFSAFAAFNTAVEYHIVGKMKQVSWKTNVMHSVLYSKVIKRKCVCFCILYSSLYENIHGRTSLNILFFHLKAYIKFKEN